MVYKRGKGLEFRKRKESEKEKRAKERKKKAKEVKDALKSYRLSLVILLLIGVNLLFIISSALHFFAARGTTNSIKATSSYLSQEETPKKILKVEVLNGCGIPGVARQLTDYIRERGIDVVYYGNFENRNISETLVIDRRKYDLGNAKIIARIIGVDENRMFPQISPQRQLDVTIIIGKNYPELKAFQ